MHLDPRHTAGAQQKLMADVLIWLRIMSSHFVILAGDFNFAVDGEIRCVPADPSATTDLSPTARWWQEHGWRTELFLPDFTRRGMQDVCLAVLSRIARVQSSAPPAVLLDFSLCVWLAGSADAPRVALDHVPLQVSLGRMTKCAGVPPIPDWVLKHPLSDVSAQDAATHVDNEDIIFQRADFFKS